MIYGAHIEPWTAAQCDALLAWLCGEGAAVAGASGRWLLAHCDDGVVWGERPPGVDRWSLSGAVFPEASPALDRDKVQQLRVFGLDEEVMVWRTDDGLRGRRLSSAPMPKDAPAWVHPGYEDERRLLVGTTVRAVRDGFSLLVEETGARHAAPWVLPPGHLKDSDRLRLRLRHHFESDDKTGVVRVVVTRIVALEGQ